MPSISRSQPFAYIPTVGPLLKVLLAVVFASVALLGATGVYLTAVRGLEQFSCQVVTSPFTLWAFLGHVVLGVMVVAPFVVFGLVHWKTARGRSNRRAVRLGLWVFGLGLVVVATGVALIQIDGAPQLRAGSWSRTVVLIGHGLAPLVAVILYVGHRRAGPRIRWKWGAAWASGVATLVGGAIVLHHQDPRDWYAVGPAEGEKYFHPAATRTVDGNFIPAKTLMMDSYCLQCHPDAYNSWVHSAHHFSSFNNPAYLFSVRETREAALKRDGNVRASRWCAGCHDPVPFLSGAFDDPAFDDVNHTTAHAGITCTVCHAMTHVNGPEGNGNYTIEEPLHYPFAQSESSLLQWVNRQVVRAKPDFHKQSFLKPFHRSAEFCSTCHKVSLPPELNHYKEFLRGQNHYDSYLLSGVSGHGARSFYYPESAKQTCAACHMPTVPSSDPAARDFAGTGKRSVHDHMFPGANTALPWLLSLDPKHSADAKGLRNAARRHADFLCGTAADGTDRKLRIDIFGLKADGRTDGELLAPLRPSLPKLIPGKKYLVEVVIRTLGVGHHFTQGTVDSNEVWVEFTASSGGRVIGTSGRLSGPDDAGPLDEWAHRVNVLLLDRNGGRINRRNPQDIFTPLYDHQIPPGAGQVAHYLLEVPPRLDAPVELSTRVRYRKFDHEYMALVYQKAGDVPILPIVDLCEDQVTLPVAGVNSEIPDQPPLVADTWQRWNDYGIGCLLEGGPMVKRGELRQAEAAFREVAKFPVASAQGHLNTARVLIAEGRLADAATELNAARQADPPPPWWVHSWLTGIVTAETATSPADLDAAIECFAKILDPANQPHSRGFDFTKDYVIRNLLADTVFKRSLVEDGEYRDEILRRAVAEYRRTLDLDPEDLDAHFGLYRCFARLGTDLPSNVAGGDPIELARELATSSNTTERRCQAAAALVAEVSALSARPFDPLQPRLPQLKKVLAEIAPAASDSDPAVRGAVATALALIHRTVYELLRPDDNARSHATTVYRSQHPPADHAAEAVVIYRLHPAVPGEE